MDNGSADSFVEPAGEAGPRTRITTESSSPMDRAG